MIFQACKTPKHSLIKKGSFALSFFVRVIPTNISKNSVLFDVCILDVQNGKFNTFQIIQAQICSTFHVFVIAASETSLQPQRCIDSLIPVKCYYDYVTDFYIVLKGVVYLVSVTPCYCQILFHFSTDVRGPNDWNYFTALTLSRDGYQFNYGQLKMIYESPAMDIYHHYELLTTL